MIKTSDVKYYKEINENQLTEAILIRREFCKELRTDLSVSELSDTLIRIFNFEFGEGWDR